MGMLKNGIFLLKILNQFIMFVKNAVIDQFDEKGFVLFIFLIKKLMLNKIFK